MKRGGWIVVWTLLALAAPAQRRWDGGARDSLWLSAANWHPDGVPVPGEDVLLDNLLVTGDYQVWLPAGNLSVEVDSLVLRPGPARSIRLIVPASNTAVPALTVSGPGESLRLEAGAVLLNASGALSGDPLQLNGLLRISDGGRYIHGTPRGNARLIDRLSAGVGTAQGIFEFDVPGSSGYTVSLTGNVFGSLVFRANAGGGLKSYSGSGSSELHIRGDLLVDTGAGLTSTLTACIRLDGNLTVRGMLSLQPVTAGTTGRCLLLTSVHRAELDGSRVQLHQHFRETVIGPGHTSILTGKWTMPFSSHRLRMLENATLSTGIHALSGAGAVDVEAGAVLCLGDRAGIAATGDSGNIRTTGRYLHPNAHYVFDGTGAQQTGTGFPAIIRSLTVNKPEGDLMLSRPISVTGSLGMLRGLLRTSDDNLLTFSGDTISHPANAYGLENGGWASGYVDGPFRRITTRPGRFIMPIGRNGVFAPMAVNRTGNDTLIYRVAYVGSQAPTSAPIADPPLYRISDREHWLVQTEPAGATTATIPELSWRFTGDSLTRQKWQDSLRIVAFIDSGGQGWVPVGVNPVTSGNGGIGMIRADQSASSYSMLTLGMARGLTGLPITGIRLQGKKDGERTMLTWETLGTSGTTTFHALRLRSQGRQDTIGILSVPHTRNGQRFSLWDSIPQPGWNQYKVCAIEEGAEYVACSGIVAICHPERGGLQVYPVPAGSRLHWNLPGKQGSYQVRIETSDGQLLREHNGRNGIPASISLEGLKPGIYLLRLRLADRVWVRRFVKTT